MSLAEMINERKRLSDDYRNAKFLEKDESKASGIIYNLNRIEYAIKLEKGRIRCLPD
jgi:hypothetical protein